MYYVLNQVYKVPIHTPFAKKKAELKAAQNKLAKHELAKKKVIEENKLQNFVHLCRKQKI